MEQQTAKTGPAATPSTDHDRKPDASACCAPKEQAACCAPGEKDACCGTARTTATCGCR